MSSIFISPPLKLRKVNVCSNANEVNSFSGKNRDCLLPVMIQRSSSLTESNSILDSDVKIPASFGEIK